MKKVNFRLVAFTFALLFFALNVLSSCAPSIGATINYVDGSSVDVHVNRKQLTRHQMPSSFYLDVCSIVIDNGTEIYYITREKGMSKVPRRKSVK